MKSLVKYISKQFGKPEGLGGIFSTFVMNCLNRKMYLATEKRLQITSDDVILDIGFGNGYFLKRVVRCKPQKLLGIEISQTMLQIASKKNTKSIKDGKMILFRANINEMPLAENSIDKIYTINTVYFWDDLQKGFSEIKRVLKYNGLFVNAIYTEQWLNKLAITKYGFAKYSVEHLANETQKCGFTNVQIIEIHKNKSLLLVCRKQ